ncbi:MAG TPA: hypothetical protein VGP61_13395, partial [Gemmatimonadales bacterium]|nr:hypothetical protein [Gemmatimonadales bacterium]
MKLPTPRLIGHAPAGTSSGAGGSRGRLRGLPDDLLRDASRRLAVVALLGAILWIVGPGLDHLALGTPLGPPDVIAAVSAAFSFALFLYTRWSTRSPGFLLDLGLCYQILTAAAIGLLMHLSPEAPSYEVRPVFTWIGIVVLLFAAIIPSSPGKTFVASLFSVAMGPLAMLLAKARGTWDFGPDSKILLMHYPDFILVGVAVVISHVVTGLGRQVTRAR